MHIGCHSHTPHRCAKVRIGMRPFINSACSKAGTHALLCMPKKSVMARNWSTLHDLVILGGDDHGHLIWVRIHQSLRTRFVWGYLNDMPGMDLDFWKCTMCDILIKFGKEMLNERLHVQHVLHMRWCVMARDNQWHNERQFIWEFGPHHSVEIIKSIVGRTQWTQTSKLLLLLQVDYDKEQSWGWCEPLHDKDVWDRNHKFVANTIKNANQTMQKGGWYWATINIEDLGGAPKTFVNRGMKTNWNLALFQTLAIPKDDSLVLHPPPQPPKLYIWYYIICIY